MGIMDKFKTLFTVEVEEEEPIKKEVIKVEIETPVEEVKKEIIKEPVVEVPKPVAKVEEKNVFFDDLEFDNMTRSSMPKKDYYQKKEVKKDSAPKKFTPSPVISPIYGVLDKNYTKEDIKPVKSSANFEFTRTGDISIDDIRRKAYGTLEDELEINLFKENVVEDVKKEEIDLFDELEDMDSLEELNDLDSKEVELLREIKEERISYEEISEDETLDLNKEDLFDLIDSMYEKRGEE